MKFTSAIITLIVSILFISCSGSDKNRSSSEYLSAYMKDNKNVVLFGKINAKQILEKAEYKKIPKASVLISSEMKQYEAAIDLNQGITFALEGPFDKQGNPGKLLAFAKVKNMDSLTNKISSLGLMLQSEGDMEFVQENDVTIGIQEHLAIFITKTGKYDGKAALIEAFDKTNQDVSEGKVDQILAQKGDILSGVSFENLYASSNTSINNLDATKKKEFEALVKDSYIKSSISFDKGQAVFKSENLFSNELMNRMFLVEDNNKSILAKLGKGNARLGLAMNLDVKKMENFLDDFAPDFKRNLMKGSFQMQLAMSTLGDKPLTNLLSGKLGMVMVGDMMKDGSLVPEANIHIGLGNKGKEIKDMISAFFPAGTDAFGMKMQLNDKEITISSGKSNSNKLTIPQFADDFGKKGISMFVNFDGMDMKSLDLDDGAKAFYALQNIMITVDNKGSKMVIKGKNPNQNILKQIIDVYVKDLEDKIGAIN